MMTRLIIKWLLNFLMNLETTLSSLKGMLQKKLEEVAHSVIPYNTKKNLA